MWFEDTFGLRYASSTLERLLWRMGCTQSSDEVSTATWSYELPRHPDWLTPERMRRIESLVRRGVNPNAAADPLTVRALVDHMVMMKRAMHDAGASETDLVRALNGVGIVEHPLSKSLVFEADALLPT